MRKLRLFFLSLFASSTVFAQDYSDRGRYYDDKPDFALATPSTIGYGLLFSGACFLLGYLINSMSKKGSVIGGLLFLVGILGLIPLFTLLQIIFQSLLALCFILALVGGGLYFLYSLFTSKK
jgi:hypothetical protein